MNNKEKIIDHFRRVKAMGWVRSNRSNNTGIGKTFEDYVGVIENNIADADLFGFEIKAHREEASSYVTLCTKSPSFPNGANAYLLSSFGTPYDDNPNLNRLHTSMFANNMNSYGGKYSFKLRNDRNAREIRIEVYDALTKELIDDTCGYNYDALENIFAKKLKNLFYVSAERRHRSDLVEEFYFNNAEIYTDPSFDRFLDLLDQGKIMYDIRMGSYQSGVNIGKPHDHGSGFRIKPENIHLLYSTYEKVE